jgi:hypothetical protein
MQVGEIMTCFGCGKNIPFAGDVCPYCHRDKKGAQLLFGALLIFGFLGIWAGSIFSITGSVVGAFIGMIIGLIFAASCGALKKPQPPHVQIHNNLKEERVSSLLEDRLAKLNSLKEKGLITEEEFSGKKWDILRGLFDLNS